MKQAVIIAGGRAMRLRPYTQDVPKAMVEVAGRPIIDHQLRWLASGGVADVVVSCGWRAEVLAEHLGDGSRFGVRVTYVVEPDPLGRGGGLKLAARSLRRPADRFLALNSDVLTDFDPADIVAQHERLRVSVTVALAAFRTSWGVADLDGDLVTGFRQSPALPYWINGGIYVFEPEVVELLPDRGDHEDTTFPALAAQRRLGAYRIPGWWRGIDTVKDVQDVSDELVARGG